MALEDLLNRQVPHDVLAEQAVIGAMLIDERTVSEVIGILNAKDFYSSVNGDIFESMYSMFSNGKPVDLITVRAQLIVDGASSDDVDTYLRDLMLITPSAANAVEYAHTVKDLSLLRGIMDAGNDISEMAVSGEGGAMNILEAAEKKVYSLRAGRSRAELESISKILEKVYIQVQEAAARGVGIPGISTGFSDLDRYIMGLNKSDLIFIASRPGMGKTSFALNIALNVAKESGKQVAIFSLEMSREQLAMRMLSSQARVDNKRLQTGRLNASEWNSLAEAAEYIRTTDLLINDDASLTVAEMNAQCRRLTNLGLVVIDYLQLMSAASNERGHRSENRVQVVSEISRMMKVMAKELDIPIICLSQLNRESEKTKGNNRPMLSQLRESGSIEQDADIVMGLYRDDYYNDESEVPNEAECILLKNRRGETAIVEMMWEPQFTAFMPKETRYTDAD